MLSPLLTILISLLLLSGCTTSTPQYQNNLLPTPTRIPGTEKLNQVQFQHFSQKGFGLEFDYPSDWVIKNSTTNQVKIENKDSSATITVDKKNTRLDPGQFDTKQLLTVAKNFPAYLKSNDQFSQTDIYIPMGKIHYIINLNNPGSVQNINLTFGKMSLSFDPSSNSSAFSCPPNSNFDPSSQPDEYLPWTVVNCPKL